MSKKTGAGDVAGGDLGGGSVSLDTGLTAEGVVGIDGPSARGVCPKGEPGSNPRAKAMEQLVAHEPTGKVGDLPGQSAAELNGRDWEPDD